MTHYRFELTPRQEQIMDLMAQGKGRQQIALEMGMADQTLKNVIAGTGNKLNPSIFSRMGARDQTQAVIAYLGWRSLKERGLA